MILFFGNLVLEVYAPGNLGILRIVYHGVGTKLDFKTSPQNSIIANNLQGPTQGDDWVTT